MDFGKSNLKFTTELEGIIVEQISQKTYRVNIQTKDYPVKTVDADVCGGLYYDGVLLNSGDEVIVETRLSSPDKYTITYHFKKR